jgi:hypothetical protein
MSAAPRARIGQQARRFQVALPERRVQACLGVDQGFRLHPLISRETPRWSALYRRRAAVEREFGRLKHG